MKKISDFLKITICLFICFIINNSYGQSPNYIWAKGAGGIDKEAGLGIATDADGNSVVAGAFSSSNISFGSITLTNTQAGNFDLFVVKYNASGNVLWAKSTGGIDVGGGAAVAIDANGNIFVTGTFITPTISFDTITLTNANAGNYNMFIVKYNSNGDAIWADHAEGISVARSLATDASRNVFITGSFYSPTVDFGTNSLTNLDTTGYTDDLFLVKYDNDGNVLWAKRAGGNYEDVAYSVATDKNGNAFVTGYFIDYTMSFDSIIVTNIQAGYDYIFLAKYNASGDALWAKGAGGGIDYDDAYAVATDEGGNVFVTGRFNSPTITFDSITLINTWFFGDMFLAKYDAAGNVLWARNAGGTYTDMAWAITTDENGNAIVTGDFWSSTITFDSITLTNTNVGSSDLFLVAYDANGNVAWAKSAGESNDDYGVSVATDASGNILLTGNFMSPTITFGSTSLTNSNNSGNHGEMYVTKLENSITGLNKVTTEEYFSIYPIPSSGEFNVEPLKLTVQHIEIYNVWGEKINASIRNKDQSMVIDLSLQPNGIYFLSIETEQKTINHKLIIEK